MNRELKDIRFAGDSPDEALSKEEVAERTAASSQAAIRRFLLNGMEIGSASLPGVWSLIRETAGSLGFPDWRAFVFPSADHAAFCFLAPVPGSSSPQVVLALSSQIIRDLDDVGLRFVIGHELGHAVFNHHGYPDPQDAESESERTFLLELKRSAEFSADRVGLLASKDLKASIRSCIQLASGLPLDYLGDDAESAFISQMREVGEAGTAGDLEDATHPPLPIRALNLGLFARSHHFANTVGSSQGRLLEMEAIDSSLYEALGKLRGGRGAASATKCADLASFWAVVALFASDNRYSSNEQEWLTGRFGRRRGEGALRFMSNYGKESSDRALHRFRAYCPKVKDARMILRSQVTQMLEEAASVAGLDHPRTSKTFRFCLEALKA